MEGLAPVENKSRFFDFVFAFASESKYFAQDDKFGTRS
jgi:hypothetical protein